MKKILSFVLAVMMMFAMSISVFAESLIASEIDGNLTGDVVIAIKGENDEAVEKVYKVQLAWDPLTFTFGGATWNTTDLVYENGTWQNTEAYITVTNFSNAEVGVSASMDTYTQNGVTAELQNNNFTLASAEGGTADFEKIKVQIDPACVPTTQDGFKLGTITVALTK